MLGIVEASGRVLYVGLELNTGIAGLEPRVSGG